MIVEDRLTELLFEVSRSILLSKKEARPWWVYLGTEDQVLRRRLQILAKEIVQDNKQLVISCVCVCHRSELEHPTGVVCPCKRVIGGE